MQQLQQQMQGPQGGAAKGGMPKGGMPPQPQ